jgi:hypothetical protein
MSKIIQVLREDIGFFSNLSEEEIEQIKEFDSDPDEPIKAVDLAFTKDYIPEDYHPSKTANADRAFGPDYIILLENETTERKIEIITEHCRLAAQVCNLTKREVKVRLWGDQFTFYEDEQCPCTIKEFKRNGVFEPASWIDRSLLIELAPFHRRNGVNYGTLLECAVQLDENDPEHSTPFGISLQQTAMLPIFKTENVPTHYWSFTAPHAEHYDVVRNYPPIFKDDVKILEDSLRTSQLNPEKGSLHYIPFLKCVAHAHDKTEKTDSFEYKYIKKPFMVTLAQPSARIVAQKIVATAVEVLFDEDQK